MNSTVRPAAANDAELDWKEVLNFPTDTSTTYFVALFHLPRARPTHQVVPPILIAILTLLPHAGVVTVGLSADSGVRVPDSMGNRCGSAPIM